MNQKLIIIANDHAATEMKKDICKYFDQKQIKYENLGTDSNESVDYPDYAFKLCQEVLAKNAIGILICGTGFGMTIAANKVKGIRAVNVYKPETAALGVEHNNANVLCLSARFNDLETNIQIINNFLNATFNGDRHLKRVNKISEYEENC